MDRYNSHGPQYCSSDLLDCFRHVCYDAERKRRRDRRIWKWKPHFQYLSHSFGGPPDQYNYIYQWLCRKVLKTKPPIRRLVDLQMGRRPVGDPSAYELPRLFTWFTNHLF